MLQWFKKGNFTTSDHVEEEEEDNDDALGYFISLLNNCNIYYVRLFSL